MNDDHYARTDITMGRLRELLRHEKDNQALRIVNAELLKALKRAVEAIRAFHGIGLGGAAAEHMWTLYQQSPEMKEINAAIAKAEGQ